MNNSGPQKRYLCTKWRKSSRFNTVIVACLAPGLLFFAVPIQANPSGGVVVHGDIHIGAGSGGNLQINQNSLKAIINWDDFSIDAGELTQFNQSSINAAVLNRVTGGNPSEIHGALKANGSVFVINPNGILVGATGTIDVHGLVLSTLDVSNGEFLAGGDMVFEGDGEGVTNLGRINAIGGDVFLIGKTVTNSGSITASGTVGLGAGEEVLITASETSTGERMFVRSTGAGASGTGVLNDGTIQGAAIELKAHGNMYALAINNKGSVRATGAVNSGGRVFLRGVGGSISNSGSIRASSPGAGRAGRILIEAAYAKVDGMLRAEAGKVSIAATHAADLGGSVDVSSLSGRGGAVTVEAPDISLSGTSSVNASGQTGGGVIQIGGGFQGKNAEIENAETLSVAAGSTITADSLESGSGGAVIFWSDDVTVFQGDLSARGTTGNGGFAEISGKNTLGFHGSVDLGSDSGAGGMLLLDPTDITISDSPDTIGNVDSVALSNTLDTGTDVIITSNFGAAGPNGDITVNDRVEWYQDSAAITGGTLSLLAMGDVIINDSVRSAGEGGINIVAGWDGETGLANPLTDLDGDAQSNGVLFSMQDVLDTMVGGDSEGLDDAAGNAVGTASGSIFIGSSAANVQINVGSRFGDTLVAGHDLFMQGDTNTTEAFVQLGFTDNGTEYQISAANRNGHGVNNGLVNEWWGSDGSATGADDATSTLNVTGKNYINLLGGTEFSGTGDAAFLGAGSGATGDIVTRLSGRLDMKAGSTRSYVQIGHGGSAEEGFEDRARTQPESLATRDGFTLDTRNARQFFSTTWKTNTEADPFNGSAYRVDGDITIETEGDILVLAAPALSEDPNNVANGNTNPGNYAMIGHGGSENHGSYHGDISVIANGAVGDGAEGADVTGSRLEGIGIDLIAGRDSNRFARIGHGSSGEGNPSSIYDQKRSGEITVRAEVGAIRMQGYEEPLTTSRSDQYSGVQIGHGGAYAEAPRTDGNFTGNSLVPDISGSQADTSSWGDITVLANGTYEDPNDASSLIGIGVRAGNGRYAYGKIGHGGANQRALSSGAEGYQGDIDVQAPLGDIVFQGAADKYSSNDFGYGRNHLQIGHGGTDVDGVKGGLITVLAGQGTGATDGDILFSAGKHYESFAQIGHGGYAASGGVDSLANEADIRVNAYGEISFVSGASGTTDAMLVSQAYANDYFNRITAGTSFRLGYYQAQDRYVMIGHGGRDADGVIPNEQDIEVISGTGDADNADGDTTTGGITFVSGDQDRDFAQIGHGGYANGANDADGFSGDINIDARGGSVIFDGSIVGATDYELRTDASYDGVNTGIRTVSALEGGARAYIQIGHGGYVTRGDHSGEITIISNGSVEMIGAVNNPTFVQSYTSTDDFSAIEAGILNPGENKWINLNPRVTTATTRTDGFDLSLGPVNVKPGTLTITLDDGTVITDSPDLASDELTSNIVDASTGKVLGTINYQRARIRFNTDQVGTGSGTVDSMEFTSIEGYKQEAYAQIGHGGLDADGPNDATSDNHILPGNSGEITIEMVDGLTLSAGAFYRSYAQIGHGGLSTKGQHSDDISITGIGGVNAAGGVLAVAGNGGHRNYDSQAYVLIGHGGHEADGTKEGDITILAGENGDGVGLLLKAGTKEDNSAIIGHGGYSARTGEAGADLSEGSEGDITIDVSGDVSVIAGVLGKTPGTDLANNNQDGRLYAQIGHGGYDADTNQDDVAADAASEGHRGDISLVSSAGSVFIGAGDFLRDSNASFGIEDGQVAGGRLGYAMVGHGGYSARGNHYGDITVHAGFNSAGVETDTGADVSGITVVGGMNTQDNSNERFSFAMIGHGGRSSNGNMGREDDLISVMADGDIEFRGGEGQENFVQLGNGGRASRGDHQGDIQVIASGDISFTAGGALREGEEPFSAAYSGVSSRGNLSIDRAADTDLVATRSNGTNEGRGIGEVNLIHRDVVPGTLRLTTPDGVVVIDEDGDGSLYVVSTGDFTSADLEKSGVTALVLHGDPGATAVGSIDYDTGVVTFDADFDIDPNSAGGGTDPTYAARIIANFDHAADSDHSYAQLGHGGSESDNPNGDVTLGHRGSISVGSLNGSISFSGGDGTASYTQLGHGGDSSRGSNEGDITVRAAQNIEFIAGSGIRASAQLGHGGYDADADSGANAGHSGIIKVSAGSGSLFTSLGVGQFNDLGDFNFDSVADSFTFGETNVDSGDVLISGGDGTDSYGMLGHGGRAAGGDHEGVIAVSSFGDISLIAGGATRSYAQVGHGGHASAGDLSGDIHIIAEEGDILVDANVGSEAYALIGHGDDRGNNINNAAGSREGGIQVIGNTITLDRHGNRAAWIGHSFKRTGNVNNTFAAANVDLTNVFLDGGILSDVYKGGGYQVIALDGFVATNDGAAVSSDIVITDAYRDNFITPNIQSGDFALSAGNITVDSDLDSTTTFATTAARSNYFSLFATGNIDVNESILNPGTGHINLIAGAQLGAASDSVLLVDAPSIGVDDYQRINHLYCPPTGRLSFSEVKGDGFTFGDSTGRVQISAAVNDTAVGDFLAVGSRDGETNVFGQSVIVTGGNHTGNYAQIGFNSISAEIVGFEDTTGNATGDIMVEAGAGGVSLTGGTINETYAMIGHGGDDINDTSGTTDDPTHSGMISVRADRVLSGNAGDITMTSIGGSRWTMIGHGGDSLSGDHSGDIVVIGHDITMTGGNFGSPSQIGHGGLGVEGNLSGDIYVNFDPDPDHDPLTDDGEVRGGTGEITLNRSGNGTDSYLQIGHGGRLSNGSKDGEIYIGKAAGVSVLAGGRLASNSARSYAQIGHGGSGSSGDVGSLSNSDITIKVDGTAGSDSVVVSGGLDQLNYAMIGHGGDSATAGGSGYFGDISVMADAGNIVLEANSGADNENTRAFAMVGHGGYANGALNGDADGDITLTTEDGGLTMTGGADAGNNFAQVGHGGSNVDATNGFTGNITVSTTGDISATAGTEDLDEGASENRYVMIGHGGFGSNGSHGAADEEIRVTSSLGSINFSGGPHSNHFAQLGNGGRGSLGDHQGSIFVSAGAAINFIAGSGNDSYVQLGHGGYGARGDHGGTRLVEGVTVNQVIDVQAATGITFTAGLDTDTLETDANAGNMRAYAQLGHGGRDADNPNPGNYADNTAGTAGFPTVAQRVGNTADISVVTTGGDISVRSGTQRESYAQFGHGGAYTDGDHTGDMVVRADEGSITFDAKTSVSTDPDDPTDPGSATGSNNPNARYVMMGHGGYYASGSHHGDITATAGTDGSISFSGGNGDGNAYAQLGHGGRNDDRKASNENNYNDRYYSGTLSGDITVTADVNITFEGGSGGSTYAQIGHGGLRSSADVDEGHEGTIGVTALNGSVSLIGGTGSNAFAIAGHGGFQSMGNHGMFDADGSGMIENAITVTGETGVIVQGRSTYAFAQIGHGGFSSSFDSSFLGSPEQGATNYHLNIPVATPLGTAGNVTVTSNSGGLILGGASTGTDGYSQIGNGGRATFGSHTGNITVDVKNSIDIEAGSGSRTYAMIGNGGNSTTGTNSVNDGTITVKSSAGSLSLDGGSSGSAGAQIGHGGVNTRSATGLTTDSARIEVSIAGAIDLTAGSGNNAFAQIGHGGTNSNRDHLGNICVHAGSTITLDAYDKEETSGTNSYVQIGNGGFNAWADHSGNITVVSGTSAAGGISLLGGGDKGRSAQIGHGGANAAARIVNLAGEIVVVSDNGGGLTMKGGNEIESFSMVGHGDGYGTYGDPDSGNTGGTRQGGIQYYIDDAYSFTAGGTDSNVYLHHRTNTDGGLNLDSPSPTYLGGSGYQFLVNDIGNSVDSTSGGAFEGNNVMIGGNVGLGDVVVTFDGDLTVDVPDSFVFDSVDHDFNFVVLATGNLNFNRNYQNAGTGDVALVAGWSGVQAPSSVTYVEVDGELSFCDPILSAGAADYDDKTSWGNIAGGDHAGAGASGGRLTIGDAANTGSVVVGTQGGSTILRGYEIEILGGASADAFTQVGFITSVGSVAGADPALAGYRPSIDIQAREGGLTLQGGEGAGAYAQIGHGGADSTATQIGDTFGADIVISFCEPGDLILGSLTAGGYAQIGHGGSGASFTGIDGDITIGGAREVDLQGGDTAGAYVQIGHGGDNTGVATVGAKEGLIQISESTSITVEGGSTSDTFAQIGHGGNENLGDSSGNIELTTTGKLEIMSGSGTDSYAQVGHGGRLADGDHGVAGDKIDVKAASLNVQAVGTTAHAQLGHGGYQTEGNYTADILVNFNSTPAAPGALEVTASDGSNAYAQIGHGGAINVTGNDNTKGGDIDVSGFSSVALTGGSGFDAFAQIGHGGDGNDGDITGDVRVDTTGAVTLQGDAAAVDDRGDGYVQIGHGGHEVDGIIGAADGSNETVVIADGGVSLAGGGRPRAYAQIGFGGNGSDASTIITGGTYVNFDPATMSEDGGGAISLTGGAGESASAMIGMGGVDSAAALEGDVTVYGASLGLTATTSAGAESSSAQIGHRGDGVEGEILVEVDGNATISAASGIRGFATVGHGDANNSDGVTEGNIHLGVGGNLQLNSGDGSGGNFATVGHARNSEGSIGGDIFAHVDGSAILNAAAANSSSSNSQIGHFGFSGEVDSTGVVTLLATDGVVLTASAGSMGAAQVGHSSLGGGDFSGSVSVVSEGNIALTGGSDASSVAAIGHGLASVSGTHTGGVNVYTTGSITMSDGASGGALISHQTSEGVAEVDYLASEGGDSGYSIVALGGLDLADTLDQQTGDSGVITLTETIAKALVADDVTIASGGTANNLVIGDGTQSVTYDSDNNLAILSGGDLTINSGIQNTGEGAIGLLAGWSNSGSTAALAPLMAGLHDKAVPVLGDLALPDFSSISINGPVAATEFGDDSAIVRIGDGTQTTGISVGSRNGVTEILGDGIEVTGSMADDAYAQLGYFSPDATTDTSTIDGDLNLSSGAGGITVEGGRGENTFAQVGHGGILEGPEIDADIDVRLTAAGAISVSGGGDEFAYAQLGHGGSGYVGDLGGSIITDGNVTTATVEGGTSTGAYAQLGHGGAESEGAKTGVITLEAESILVDGGSLGLASAQIGHGGNASSGTLEGALTVTSTVGDVTVSGGDFSGANAQIGHGGLEFSGAVTSQPLTITSANDVLVSGGTTTSGMIGHGGTLASGGPIRSDITVTAAGDVTLNDGSGALAFAQIGNGGAVAGGTQGGDISVTGVNVNLTSTGTIAGTYTKIGHGDYYRGALASFGGTGAREGDIEVSATGDVILSKSLIGHGSANSQALIDPASSTQIKAGDDLIANADSQLNGGSEFRAYLNERKDNKVASGVVINGDATWTGAETDPSPQVDSEFTRSITGENPSSPLEHTGAFDSGPEPTNPAGFAFYYDTIAIGVADGTDPDPGPGGGPDPVPGGGGTGGDPLGEVANTANQGSTSFWSDVIAAIGGSDELSPEDRLIRENQKAQEEYITRFNNFIIEYRGFDQYSPSGESIYSYILSSGRLLEAGAEADADEEDALRRLRRTMQQIQASEEAQEENAAQEQASEEMGDVPLAVR
ncbi:MAG: filamentous hemagglutinin N-terminal domain-containing protein [Verrucomicrobiales bacterium]|nr:filamentous hemagglutinin N-terminal domain-containing protein [Verrucomicrobiales bacterium]